MVGVGMKTNKSPARMIAAQNRNRPHFSKAEDLIKFLSTPHSWVAVFCAVCAASYFLPAASDFSAKNQ